MARPLSEGYLLSNASSFPKEHRFLEESQASPVCASGNSNMQMSMGQLWNTDGNLIHTTLKDSVRTA